MSTEAGAIHEAVSMHALLFQSSNQSLNQTVLLRRVRGDEFLPQAVAAHQRGIAATGEHQAIVGTQQKRRLDPAQRAEAGN